MQPLIQVFYIYFFDAKVDTSLDTCYTKTIDKEIVDKNKEVRMKNKGQSNWDWLVKWNDDGTFTKLFPARYRKATLWNYSEEVGHWMNPVYGHHGIGVSNPWGIDIRIRNGADPMVNRIFG